MKKNDVILVISILFLGFILIGVNKLFIQKDGDAVIIKVDGRVIQTISLSIEQHVEIDGAQRGKNYLLVKDGYAKMEDADCPDLLCVHQKKISRKGETIVCLPNKVVIEVITGDVDQLDAVVN